MLLNSYTTCETYWVTGYAATDFPGFTADGTHTWTALDTGDHIVAASYNLPIDTTLTIEGLPYVYRVADRGKLRARHIDVLVATRAEAYNITAYREVCTQ
jgi:3D (Asp-Asp-Asp) domain-containing protein